MINIEKKPNKNDASTQTEEYLLKPGLKRIMWRIG